MDRAVDDLLKEGIANTENEIFSEAVGKDLPSTEGGPGDRSAEEMGTGHEGQLEPQETETAAAAGEGEAGATDGEGAGKGEEKAEGEGEQPRDPKTGQFAEKPAETKPAGEADDKPVDPKARVPLSELISERKARQALQTQLDSEKSGRVADKAAAQTEFDKLNARIDQLFTAQKPAQPATPDQPKQPDIFEDPNAFAANLENGLQSKLERRFVEADLVRQHRQDGEKFLTAYNAITTQAKNDPAVAAEIRRIFKSGAPGLEIMDWHQKQEAARIIGNDPAAFVAKTEAELREKLSKDPEFLKSIGRAPAPQNPGQQQQRTAPTGESPRHVTRLPPSLNGASGGQSGGKVSGGQQVIDGSDRGVFDAAFAE
jgi:hypothetical protein